MSVPAGSTLASSSAIRAGWSPALGLVLEDHELEAAHAVGQRHRHVGPLGGSLCM